MSLKEHAIVQTKVGIDGPGDLFLPAGTSGVIVEVYGDGDAYEVEFEGLVLTLVASVLETAL